VRFSYSFRSLLELLGEGLGAAVGFFPGGPDAAAFAGVVVLEALGQERGFAFHFVVDGEGFAAPAALEEDVLLAPVDDERPGKVALGEDGEGADREDLDPAEGGGRGIEGRRA
jgi:hypothetical protein